MKGRKRIGLILLSVIIVALIVYGFMPRPALVSTAEVTEGPMEVVLEEEGRTRVKDRYSITAPVAGFVQRLPFEVGDSITKGQRLITLESLPSQTLDPRQYAQSRARIAAAEAAFHAADERIQAARADSALAAAEYGRVKGLHDQGSATQQTLDQALANRQRAQSQLSSAIFSREVANYEYEAAQTALQYAGADGTRVPGQRVEIVAPTSGCIFQVYQKNEGIVPAGQPLVDIGDPGALEVVVDVLSQDAVRISSGMHVRFERWGGEHTLKGRVRLVEPVGFTKISALGVEEQRVLSLIDFTSPAHQWSRLGDGYRLQAQIILWASDHTLQIPGNTLFRQGQDWAVFVIEGGRARIRPVEIGQRSGLMVQVLDGLSAGETLITHPEETVSNGARIRVR